MLKRSSLLSAVLSFAALTTTAVSLGAQSPAIASLKPVAQANRIAAHPDFGPQTQLTGHLPAWVASAPQVSGQPIDTTSTMKAVIVLQRDATVQAAFEKLLADQQNPSSPLYHEWLTPEQVGKLYGPTDADVAAVTSWLTSQGLTVDLVANSHTLIDVHGSAAALGNAFRTSFANYDLNGETRFSAVSEPSVPSAIAPVVKFIYGLTQVPVHANSMISAPRKPDALPSATNPKPNLSLSSGDHYLTPGDWGIIYDVNSVYTGGNKGATLGTGTNRVAIIGRSRVAATDISEWAANTGISGYTLNTVIPTTGVDPGAVCTFANASKCSTGGDQGEQTLDVIRVLGTAPAVTTDLVVSLTFAGVDGVEIAAAYNVNTQKDPIMTISYGSCEVSNGTSGVNIWDNLFSTGAAEGISTFVSSGDSGANGCATSFTSTTKTYSASINAICSSTYATCVGGTQFADTASPATYWSTTNTSADVSVLSYIPEGGWNEPEGGGTAAASDCSGGTYCPSGSGGGVSLYIAKPSWQTGTGVPSAAFRYVPDVAFSAASHDGYYACLDFELGLYASQGITSADNCTNAGGGYFFGFAGTSAAAPSMAGVAALLNTKAGKAQGNLNPTLYSVANGTSGSFHDITVASSGVSGCVVTTPSMCNNSTPGSSSNSTSVAGGLQGFLLTTGYDEVTGLGSIDVAKFLTAATTSALTATTTTLTVTPASITLGASTALKATIASSSASGSVTFYANGTAISTAITVVSGVANFTYTPTAVGTPSITAVYSGDNTYATSTSTSVTLTVAASTGIATTTALTLTPASVIIGSPSMLKATVTSTSATGTVTFYSNGVAITGGTGLNLTSGVASFSYTPTTTGTFSITASYSGNATYAASTSAPATLTVSAPFTVAASPTTLSFAGGATTQNSSVITITPTSGFLGSVNLGCTLSFIGNSAPASPATCTFGVFGTNTTSTTVTNGGTATVTISSAVTTKQATHTGPLTAGSATTWGLGALLLAMAGMLLPAGRRRSLRSLRVLPVLALLGVAFGMLSGCGSGGGNPVTNPTTPVYVGSFGSYTLTVSASSTSPTYTATPVSIGVTITQ